MNCATYVNTSCHTYEWGTPHIRMSDVTRISYTHNIWMNHATHLNGTCHANEWVMSHISIRHVTHVNTSCHTHEWVMSLSSMGHGRLSNESCPAATHPCVWQISMGHVTHVNESCHTRQWVMSHMSMSHVTHVNESCHTCQWVMSPIHQSSHPHQWVMSYIATSHVPRQLFDTYVCHDSLICVTWLIDVCGMTRIWLSAVTHINALLACIQICSGGFRFAFSCVTWLVQIMKLHSKNKFEIPVHRTFGFWKAVQRIQILECRKVIHVWHVSVWHVSVWHVPIIMQSVEKSFLCDISRWSYM